MNKQLVPKLRFPEFSGEWKIKKLEELATRISDGIHATPVYDEAGEYYFINDNNLIDGKIIFGNGTKRVNLNEYKKHKKDLSERSILLSINGTVGNLAFYNNEKIILGKSACYINIVDLVDKRFIYNLLKSSIITNYFNSELTGSTIKNLSLSTIKNTKVNIPLLPEQEKIADFLIAVDDKIQQLTAKKQLLEQYKKGVMQQIFSQKIRFNDDNGNKYADWKVKKLGCLADVTTGNKDTQNKVDDGKYPFFVRSQVIEKINTFSYDGEAILTSGDGVGVGKNFHYINGKFDYHQRVYCIYNFKEAVSGKYLYLYFSEYFNKRVMRMSAKNSVDSVRRDMIMDMQIDTPTLPEQTKIADLLTQVDIKVNQINIQIVLSKLFKKALLQQVLI